jgi:hypothetical protein
MDDRRDKKLSEADAQLEQEIRLGRKFSADEALARLAGPGALKGASPVSPVQQAETEIGNWLRCNVTDAGGVLSVVLCRQIKGSSLLLENLDRPLVALKTLCRHVVNSEERLHELVREADVEWGRTMDERPYFQRQDAPADPLDPYTGETVRKSLEAMLELLPDG